MEGGPGGLLNLLKEEEKKDKKKEDQEEEEDIDKEEEENMEGNRRDAKDMQDILVVEEGIMVKFPIVTFLLLLQILL